MPRIIFAKVVLPLPLSPTTAKISRLVRVDHYGGIVDRMEFLRGETLPDVENLAQVFDLQERLRLLAHGSISCSTT